MSRPMRLELDDTVRRDDVQTDRGRFASLSCRPQDSSLPRGNVLLVPGFTGSKEDFAALLPLLAEAGWGAASYDQRGQYETAALPDDDFSLSALAADAIAVATALFGGSERVHLVGHSFGGLVAATAAIEQPDVWASLTLMCSGPSGFGGDKRRDLLEVADTVGDVGLEAIYQVNAERDRTNGVEPAPVHVEDFVHRRFLAHSPQALAAMARLLVETPDLTPKLAALDLRVSVLRGERDDAWRHDVQDELANALGTRVVVIGDAAHSPAVEQPEQTRDALARIWLG
ncbi:MAG: alpha/beta fold hydrolase [Propionibacteriales bacterium]|nr:alpha/beta fold hydrolase [Propionibacteriales bacterium]